MMSNLGNRRRLRVLFAGLIALVACGLIAVFAVSVSIAKYYNKSNVLLLQFPIETTQSPSTRVVEFEAVLPPGAYLPALVLFPSNDFNEDQEVVVELTVSVAGRREPFYSASQRLRLSHEEIRTRAEIHADNRLMAERQPSKVLPYPWTTAAFDDRVEASWPFPLLKGDVNGGVLAFRVALIMPGEEMEAGSLYFRLQRFLDAM